MPEMIDRLELRDALDSDLPFLFTLYRDVRGPEVAAWGWPPAQVEPFLRMQFDAQRRSYQAANPESKNKIVSVEHVQVGRILLAFAQGEMTLVDIALLSVYRNRGIGGYLIRRLLQNCQEGQIVLRLQVFQGNPAIQLYRRLGFVETGCDPMYIQMAWSPKQI